jgi:hypothetical protein
MAKDIISGPLSSTKYAIIPDDSCLSNISVRFEKVHEGEEW